VETLNKYEEVFGKCLGEGFLITNTKMYLKIQRANSFGDELLDKLLSMQYMLYDEVCVSLVVNTISKVNFEV